METNLLQEKLKDTKKRLVLLESKITGQPGSANNIEDSLSLAEFARYNPFPLVRINDTGEILISNMAANDYFKVEKLRGKNWNEIVQVEPNSIKVINGHLQHEYEVHGKTLLFCYRNVRHYGYINIYAFDISYQRSVERELDLERARHMHSIKMATLGEMAGGMAHELNTPLGLISLSINQVQKCIEKGKSDLLADVLLEMQDAVDRMAKLISGFKTFSREERSGEFTFVSLKKVLEESFAICKVGLKGTLIDFDVPRIIPDLSIECNPTEISQVIINLVHNARDAIYDMRKPWIKVLVEVDDEIKFEIIDSGKGIPLEIQDKLFIPFFTTKEVGKGTGLGLPIIHEIIKTHNGTLNINNEHENTCFSFTLPLIQSAGEFL